MKEDQTLCNYDALAKGLSSRAISKLAQSLLPFLKNQIEETLSPYLISKLNLPIQIQCRIEL